MLDSHQDESKYFYHTQGGGGHKLLTPPISTFVSFEVSSSLQLIEVKRCWNFKDPKLFDPIPALPPFSFVSLTHVCQYTQGWNTYNSLRLITFLSADSQNSIIFICSSHMWNMGQTLLSRTFSKYMWLQLWCHFIINVRTSIIKTGRWEYSNLHALKHVYTWIHLARGLYILVVWMWGYKILQSVNEDGIQICTPYQWYILPPFGK